MSVTITNKETGKSETKRNASVVEVSGETVVVAESHTFGSDDKHFYNTRDVNITED